MSNLVSVNNVDHDMFENNMIQFVNANATKAREKRTIESLEAENLALKGELKRRELHKRKTRKKIVKSIELAVFMVSVAFLLWVGVSYFNVIAHNMEPGQSALIWDWNFFKVFFK